MIILYANQMINMNKLFNWLSFYITILCVTLCLPLESLGQRALTRKKIKHKASTISTGSQEATLNTFIIFRTDLAGSVWINDKENEVMAGTTIRTNTIDKVTYYFLSKDKVFQSKKVTRTIHPHEKGSTIIIDVNVLNEYNQFLSALEKEAYRSMIIEGINNNFVSVKGKEGIEGYNIAQMLIPDFEISKFETSMREFDLFIDETGYITEAEKNKRGMIILEKGLSTSRGWRHGVNWRTDVNGLPVPIGDYDLPIMQISWEDAMAYCKWLDEQDPDYTYRLPTSAEWTHAANCGGYEWSYPYPEFESAIEQYANLADESLQHRLSKKRKTTSVSDGYPYRSPTGMFEPNGLGLYDMVGNVSEWCYDDSNENPNYKLVKGGSYWSNVADCNITKDFEVLPTSTHCGIGFRIVRIKKEIHD